MQGTDYHAVLTVLRTGVDEVLITIRMTGDGLDGYELSRVDPSAVTRFDGVAIAISSSNGVPAADMITIDNVLVSAGGGLADPAVVSPIPVTTSTVVDFAFAPDSSRIAFRARLNGAEASEVYAASVRPGADFALGNVLHGMLPPGSSTEDLSVNFGWTRDATGVVVAKDLETAEVLEAWRLEPAGGQEPVRIHRALVADGNVEFVVIPR